VLSYSSGNLGFRLGSASLRYAGALTQRTYGSEDSRHQLPSRVGENAPDPATSHPDQLSHLEAVLFLSSQPLPSRKLSQLAHLADGTASRTMVKELNTVYESDGRSFRVEEVAGGYQLRTQKIFAPWIRRMVSVPPEIRMSGPAMETLAVVAYRQPVMRTDIEKVRGVQCGEILRQLMDRGIVRISGRADELGRPFLYGTTRNFLEVFGLRSLDELPRASMLRANESAQTITSPFGEGDALENEPVTEEGTEVRACDATDQSEQWELHQQSTNELPVAAIKEDDDSERDDDDEDDDEDDDDDEDEDEDDGFNDEEWKEVEDDDSEEGEEDLDDEEDDDEDWDDDEDEGKVD
jgi:segregation and condensation protein B